jgi:uncharacterized repeat protein (TIGR01451 family)
VHTSSPDTVTAGAGVPLLVVVQNVGDAPLTGNLTVADTFPAGTTPVDAVVDDHSFTCNTVAQTDSCAADVSGVLPGGQVYFHITPTIDGGASGPLVNSIEVTGGGTPQDLVVNQSMTAGPAGPFAFDVFSPALLDGAGAPAVQAGSDPADITTAVQFSSRASVLFGLIPEIVPVEQFKNVVAHLPVGLVGNPNATRVRCTGGQLTDVSPDTTTGLIPACPAESQVGVVRIGNADIAPLYNMAPPNGVPAEFGFVYQAVPVVLDARVRPDDNGIDIVARNASASVPVDAVDVTFWGVPADSSHDSVRGLCLDGLTGNNGLHGTTCPLEGSTPRTAFLRLPTSCSGNPLDWSADASSFVHPDIFVHTAATSPAMTGCDVVPFTPSLTLTPTNLVPHEPTGLDANLSLPQGADPKGIDQADLKKVQTTLPPGLVINPSSANGLQACSDADLRLHQDGVATCPDASKIGTVTVTTPLLDHPLSGTIILRTQNSNDPQSGELFRIAIEIRSDDDGVDIKQPAGIAADPNTGQLTATFDEIPQLPISSLQLHFKSGPRAPLTTPDTCDASSNVASSLITSWAGGPSVPKDNGFALSGAGCAGAGFSPSFAAGTANPVAGKDSPFLLDLARDNGEQTFHSLTVNTPVGLLGRIKTAELCSDADATAGTCASASQLGSVAVGAGAGTSPFFVNNGRMYLTGPYKGAPYGLSIVVHAVAGPFDLGTVVVRAAIFVDRNTTALSVVSDPFPTILGGVPLDVRELRIAIDRPGFMFNPTSCLTKHVDATVTSNSGTNASVSSRFRVGDCASLKLAPKITLGVGSKHHTGVGASTPFSTIITEPAHGQTNLRSVSVTLPGTLNAKLAVVNRACKLSEFEAGHCTSQARVGSAVLTTPVLKDPLRGSVYFVKNSKRILPDLMIALRGQVNIDLTGKVSIPGGKRLATQFDTIPDAPFTRFQLSLVSGKNSPLGIVTNLCTKKGRAATASVDVRGQNGALLQTNPHLHINGCPARKKKRH